MKWIADDLEVYVHDGRNIYKGYVNATNYEDSEFRQLELQCSAVSQYNWFSWEGLCQQDESYIYWKKCENVVVFSDSTQLVLTYSGKEKS